ncbi:MAG: hypothetical protein KBB32_01805 [Spirochaetia bacterium]|nr:hypothetical protein [Spirochaetia bacterium]
MKPFSTRWIERITIVSLVLAMAACVSDPDPAAGADQPVASSFYLEAPQASAQVPQALAEALPPSAASGPRALAGDAPSSDALAATDPSLPDAAVPAATPAPASPAGPAVQPKAAAPTAPATTATSASPAAQPTATAKPAPKATAPSAAEPSASQPSAYATPLASAQAQAAAAQAPQSISSSLDAYRDQGFDLSFAGAGWTYLGDEDGKTGLEYRARRYDGSFSIFTLYPEDSGTYVIRFQRQDPVSGERQTSLVQVTVRDAPAFEEGRASAAGAQAPGAASTATGNVDPGTGSAAGATAVPAGTTSPATGDQASSPASALAASPAAVDTASPAATGQQAALSALAASQQAAAERQAYLLSLADPKAILDFAASELGAGRVNQALAALDRYVDLFSSGSDELYYLYGLAYEQDTPFRDIKKSYAYYKRVRDEYPRSRRWRESADRVVYLERHFPGLR